MSLRHLDRKFAVDDLLVSDNPGKVIETAKDGSKARVVWLDGMRSWERVEEWRWNGRQWR